jgi:hypothetical protein
LEHGVPPVLRRGAQPQALPSVMADC